MSKRDGKKAARNAPAQRGSPQLSAAERAFFKKGTFSSEDDSEDEESDHERKGKKTKRDDPLPVPKPSQKQKQALGGRRAGTTNYSRAAVMELLGIVTKKLPCGSTMWELVGVKFNTWAVENDEAERSTDSLKEKFTKLARMRKPTGDPECPPEVKLAKRAQKLIEQSFEGKAFGSSDDDSDGGWSDLPPPPSDMSDMDDGAGFLEKADENTNRYLQSPKSAPRPPKAQQLISKSAQRSRRKSSQEAQMKAKANMIMDRELTSRSSPPAIRNSTAHDARLAIMVELKEAAALLAAYSAAGDMDDLILGLKIHMRNLQGKLTPAPAAPVPNANGASGSGTAPARRRPAAQKAAEDGPALMTAV
jgi:hypothetical protein